MPTKDLTQIQIKRLEKPGLYSVGGVTGLYLKIAPRGSKSWILRATVGKKRRDIGLGGFPDVTLAAAREAARSCRDQIRNGIDPIIEKQKARSRLVTEQLRQITFSDAAALCHSAKSTEFRNEKHKKDWINALERHAFPVIGKRLVSTITLQDILKVLEPIWFTKTETATRVRQRLESVLTWATVSQYRDGDNPARWEGNLKEILPNPSKIRKVKHHPAVPWHEVGDFMIALRKRSGVATLALEFAILTAARSGEVRGMVWSEVDLDRKIWTVPADRIKAGRRHMVPLSNQAIKVLRNVPKGIESPYVFPAIRGGQLSDVALLAVMRRMKVEAVPHGFRSTFKDWVRSCTAYPDEVSELALAHVNSDATRAAYARDELLAKRTRLMKDWATFLDEPSISGVVTPIRSAI